MKRKKHLPKNTGMGFVFVQHLAADHPIDLFFRDPEIFETLKKKVFPKLFKGRSAVLVEVGGRGTKKV